MQSKGYTLIEVIAVITLLSLIILIAIPSINNSLKDSKNRAYNTQIEEIKSATKSWVLLNPKNLPSKENDQVVITLLQLKLANLIASDFKNPKTGDLFPDDIQISITRKGMNILYDIIEGSGTTNEILDPNAPQLILNGSISQNVEINDAYQELSATAKNKNGEDIAITTLIEDGEKNVCLSIDTTRLNNYTITYSATSDGITSSIKRVVNVVDTNAPIITIGEYVNNQTIELESNDGYILPTAIVTDNSGELVNYIVSGNFSSILPGNKKVIYKAIDSSENEAEFILNFTIRDTTNPVISSSNITVNEQTGKNTITIIASDSGVGLADYAYSYDNGVSWKKENTYVFEGLYSNILLVRDKAGNQTSSPSN